MGMRGPNRWIAIQYMMNSFEFSFSAGGTQSAEFQSQALLNGDPDGSGGDNGGYSGVKSNKSFTSLAVTVVYILSSKSQLLNFG